MLSDGRQERVLVERSERIMATRIGVHVAVAPEHKARAEAAAGRCMQWMREVERRLTRFSPESELSRLNAATGTWRRVSVPLFAVMEEALAAAEASGGLFDPTLLPVLEALGYDRDFAEIAYRDVAPANNPREASGADAGWRAIELDRAGRRMRLPPGARLDLGGIAKGWAADVALKRCFESLPDVLIDVGGDVRARGGARAGELWAIGIGDPRGEESTARDGCAAVLTLGSGGLATSGATARWWRRGGTLQHHLIDPRTRRPARLWVTGEEADDGESLIASATALAPTAAQAEVAAKMALLRGYPHALRTVEAEWQQWQQWQERQKTRAGNTCEAHDESGAHGPAALLLVLGSGAVACSENLRDYLGILGGGGDLWLN